MSVINIWLSFLAGIYAPLGALCVLPLYPGFLAFLSSQIKGSVKSTKWLGIITASGVIISMMAVGFVFTFILEKSLTKVIGVVSPIAFSILALISIAMIFDIDMNRFFPELNTPQAKNPYLSALLFGLFFGLVVLPCNPASLVILFGISSSFSGFIMNFINFVMFGLGMSLPLVLLAAISGTKSRKILDFLIRNQRRINIVSGLIMLGISLYYLFFVFRVLG